jgi:apolipoprotein N-acyltransferase
MTLPIKLSAPLASALGASLTLAYAPFSLWLIPFISLAILVGLIARSSDSRSAGITGFAFGLGWFGAGISWVHVSIADFGGLPLVASVALMVLLCAYLALYPALAFYFASRFFKPIFWPLSLPIFWLISEWLRSWVLTGFPWLSIGYSQIGSPLSGYMPVIGEIGTTAILLFVATVLGTTQSTKHWLKPVSITGVTLGLGWGLNQHAWVKETSQLVSVSLVQGNIEQSMRWAPEQDKPTMDKYLALTAPFWQQSDIIIWPEAAIPAIEPLAQDYLEALDSQAAQTKTGLITGIVNYNFDNKRAYNNLLGLGLKNSVTAEQSKDLIGHYSYMHSNRFAKHHLLPIGEFVPLEGWLRKLGPLFDLPMSSFSRGLYQQDNLRVNGVDFAPAICFEIAFPNQISANLYDKTDMIITVSNDAWFGKSHGPAQHLEIAQVRAKEFGLPVLRATNNGITAVVNHNGEIQNRLAQFVDDVLLEEVQIVRGQTPYRYLGNAPIWLISLCMLVFAYSAQRQKQD